MLCCTGFKRVNKAKLSIGWIFFTFGALFGNWAGILPAVQDMQNLDNATLGGILAVAVIGAIIGLPMVTYVANNYGSKFALLVGLFVILGSYPMIGIKSIEIFSIGVLLMGLGAGWVDTSMNAQAVVCEKMVRSPTLGLFHALYAAGGLVGALTGGILLELGFSVFKQSILFAYGLLISQILWYGWLFSSEEEKFIDKQTSVLVSQEYTQVSTTESPIVFASEDASHQSSSISTTSSPSVNEENKQTDWQVYEQPTLSTVDYFMLFIVCFLCFLSYLGQGAVSDWSAIFFYKELDTSAFVSTLGYAGFEVFVAIGAYFSDYFVMLLGRRKVLQSSGLISTIGLGLVILAPSLSSTVLQTICAIVGFSISGIGMSVVPPSVISIAGSGVLGMPPADAIAIVSSIGYLGIMVGPPMLGGISVVFGSLRWSFAVVASCMFLMSLIAACTGVGVSRPSATSGTAGTSKPYEDKDKDKDVMNPIY